MSRSARRGLVAAAVLLAVARCGPAHAQNTLLSGDEAFPNGCGSGPSFPEADFESHIAVNPRDPRNLIVTWIDGSGITIVVSASQDGGRTWSRSLVPGVRCTGDPNTVLSGDPWVSFGPDGVAYLTAGTDVGGGDPAGLERFVKILVSRSLDGGRTWSPSTTIQAAGDFNDKPSITADPRVTGTAYIVFTHGHHPDFSAGDLFVSSTRDGGRTWSAPVAIYAPLSVGTYPWGATLRVLPGGALLVTVMLWNPPGLSLNRGQFQAVAFRSGDGGATWSAPAEIAPVPVPTVQDRDDGRTVREEPGVALDVAPDGTAYAAWHQDRGDGHTEVVLSRSADGGATWSAPAAVAPARGDAFIPSLAVGRDGRLGITWYDLRADRPGDNRLTTDFWFGQSGDGGRTWTESHVAGAFDMRTAPLVDGSFFIGDYFGLVAFPGGGYASTFALAQPLASRGPSDVYYAPLGAAAGPGAASPLRPQGAARIRLTFRHRVRAARRVRLRVRAVALQAGRLRPLAGARVQVGRRSVRTNARGVARIVLLFRRPTRLKVTATKPGFVAGAARLRVLRARQG